MLRQMFIVACLSLHLFGLLASATSMTFNGLITHELFVYGNIALLACISLAAFPERLQDMDWRLLSLIILYGTSVIAPTASLHGTSLTTIEVLMVPLTILAFTWAVPKALQRTTLDSFLAVIVLVFSIHTVFAFLLAVTKTSTIFGYELPIAIGRPQLYWGERGALLTGLFANPNGLASYLLLLPATAFGLAAPQPKPKQKLLISCGFLLLIHLLLLMSRASSLTALTGLIVPAICRHLSSRQLKIFAWLTGIASLIFIAYTIANWPHDNSLCLRTFIWQGFLDAAMHTPFGSGWNSVVVYNQNPHNMFLANLVYFGVSGLLLLIALVVILGARAIALCDKDKTSAFLLCTLAAMVLIHGNVEYVITYPLLFSNSIFWLLLGSVQRQRRGLSF